MTFAELTTGLSADLVAKLKSLAGKGDTVVVSMPVKNTVEISAVRGKNVVTIWCEQAEFEQIEQLVHQREVSWEEFLLQVING
jgi:hypothetical protein